MHRKDKDTTSALTRLHKKAANPDFSITISVSKNKEEEKDGLAPDTEAMPDESKEKPDGLNVIEELLAGGSDHTPDVTFAGKARSKMKEKLKSIKK